MDGLVCLMAGMQMAWMPVWMPVWRKVWMQTVWKKAGLKADWTDGLQVCFLAEAAFPDRRGGLAGSVRCGAAGGPVFCRDP